MDFRRSAPRIIIISAVLILVPFSLYLRSLYGQLQKSFASENQFIPTRIYSDVSRIAPPQSRAQTENKLRALGYTPTLSDGAIIFQLHSIDYPTYLLPEGHISAESGLKSVTLNFSGSGPGAAMQSIQLGGKEVADIYLEPELVATLSRGGPDNGPGSSPTDRKEIRTILNFGDIPSPIWKAIIAIEDPNFLEHKGLDPRGIARAIFVDLKTLSFSQGGSTITSQLVKNLMDRRTKNIFRKANELFLALLLEVKYSKEEIMGRYLNEVYLGQVGGYEVHGVAEGAKHFFGKNIDELNLAETALMAGLIRGPQFYSPYHHQDRAIERQKLVLKKMVENGFIAQGQADNALKMPTRFAPPQTSSNKAPFFTDFVKAEMIRNLKDRLSEQEMTIAGFKIYTTLDSQINQAAQQSITQGIATLEKNLKLTPQLEGALAAVDQSTGYIRALVGGRNYGQSSFNRILNMKRQVGSTFKPIVYLTAFEKGEDAKGVPYGPGYPVEDAPWKLTYDHGKQTWAPKNYEKEFLSWTSMRLALAHSINTVAAKLGVEVGIDNVKKTAKLLGIDSDLPAVPSLSLGVAELSPVELLRAYATIANHGAQDELTVIRAITQPDGTTYARFIYHPQQVVPAPAVDLLIDTLQNVFIEGTAHDATRLGFDRPAAGKTGTTSNHRDSWFAGFTPQLTAVVWVGADQDNNPKLKLTGATSALPIWVSFMKDALAGEPPTPFPMSSSLINVRIDKMSGKLATKDCPDSQAMDEKYTVDHEPKTPACETRWPESVIQGVSE